MYAALLGLTAASCICRVAGKVLTILQQLSSSAINSSP